MGYLIEHLTDDYLREMAVHFAALDLYHPRRPPRRAPPHATGAGPCPGAAGRCGAQDSGMRAMPRRSHDGVAPSIPGLLGLPRDYLNNQLGAWKTGQRKAQSPSHMADVARQLTPEDVSAVSAWLAAQPVPRNGKPVASLSGPMPARCGGDGEKEAARQTRSAFCGWCRARWPPWASAPPPSWP